MKKSDFRVNEYYSHIPTKEELSAKRCFIQYRSIEDSYYISSDMLSNQQPYARKWNSLLYQYDNIERVVDKNEICLTRKSYMSNSRICWCIDLSSTGLVVDDIELNMSYMELGGGQVVVSLSGYNENTGKRKTASYYSTGECKSISKLEDSTNIKLKVDMMGDNMSQITKLFQQSINDDPKDCPFYLRINLRRPSYTTDRSLLLIGLMYSSKQRKEYTKKEKLKKGVLPNSYSMYLYMDIVKAERLPCRISGNYAHPKVVCTLQGDMETKKQETKTCKKTLSPVWNEYLSFGLSEDMRSSSMEVLVIHYKKLFKTTSETLGSVVLQNQYLNGSSKQLSMSYPNAMLSKRPTKRPTRELTKRSCSLISLDNLESDHDVRLSKFTNDFVNIRNTVNETDTDNNKNSVPTRNKLNDSVNNSLNSGRRAMSTLSLNTSLNGNTQDYLRTNKKVKRKPSFSKKLYRSGSISNILEDELFLDNTTTLSETHWKVSINNPDEWHYCWHTLTGVHSIYDQE